MDLPFLTGGGLGYVSTSCKADDTAATARVWGSCDGVFSFWSSFSSPCEIESFFRPAQIQNNSSVSKSYPSSSLVLYTSRVSGLMVRCVVFNINNIKIHKLHSSVPHLLQTLLDDRSMNEDT